MRTLSLRVAMRIRTHAPGASPAAEHTFSMLGAIEELYSGEYIGMKEAYQLTYEQAPEATAHNTESHTYAEAM